jgi:hypothetical protein
MKLNTAKSKFILFNPKFKYVFIPDVEVGGNKLDAFEEMKLLCVAIRNDLKWKSNTDAITKKGF